MNSLLRSFSHLKRLSLALVQSLEIDTSDLKIIEERSMVPGHGKEKITILLVMYCRMGIAVVSAL